MKQNGEAAKCKFRCSTKRSGSALYPNGTGCTGAAVATFRGAANLMLTPEEDRMEQRMLTTAATALYFIFAGNATFTLRSKESGVRYTYKVTEVEKKNSNDAPLYFVSLLTGPDNTGDFNYLGIVRDGAFRTTQKSRMPASAAPVKAIEWTLNNLFTKNLVSDKLEIWHEGRCGRCGRKLTVPESIEAGIGPECLSKMM